ncbi:hypothetical protein LUZ63_000919 [Rhynchospora breviuscula]|uniref:Dirigent protein n=1 Tax=Rhynchospora breviuscula TaxID=2022672 RepID=A0A9Q0CVX2_9POAL|nr:hypothetical protein LUZ63_000919 [Rhynchospora breviuscula]
MSSKIPKPTFKINFPRGPFEINEVYFHLYLHHTPSGPDSNQIEIVNRNLHNSFGSIVVKDWPLYDEFGPHAKLIARAQGLHIQAGMRTQNWYNSFSILFEDTRFKGSSLQVMGPSIEKGQWAIVGGTGDLAMARGVIYKKNPEKIGRSMIIELDIHAFCKSQAIIVKRRVQGSEWYKYRDMDVNGVNRIVKIVIFRGDIIDALIVYFERNGQVENTGRWGGNGGNRAEFTLKPHEYITSVSVGTTAMSMQTVVGSLTFVTNVSTHGPYGARADISSAILSSGLGVGGRIIGFHGHAGRYLNGLGVYVKIKVRGKMPSLDLIESGLKKKTLLNCYLSGGNLLERVEIYSSDGVRRSRIRERK